MTVRLSTTVGKIEKIVFNEENVKIIMQFYEFMKKIGTSERYQIIRKIPYSIYYSAINLLSNI
jgi:hypothetical protein